MRVVLRSVLLFAMITPVLVAQTPGPLRVHPTNPRYFADPTGNVVYLTGSHTWSNFQDNGNGTPPPAFNYSAYLSWMESLNHNFMRLWRWEQTRWTSETWDNDYWFSPEAPYKRTGPGSALDGRPKFDLDSLDDTYFARLRARVMEAGQRGIYVAIMLFDGWSVSNRLGFRQPFEGHPMHAQNNVNGVNGDPDGDGDGEETHSLLIPAVTAYQDAYVKRVIDAVNDLDNVLYEISNESPYDGSDAWQKRMIDTIRAYQALKPKQHPVGYTGDWTIANADLWSSNADWVSPGAGSNGSMYQDDPPAATGSKVVITDSDHLWGVGGDRVWVWKSFLRGLNPIFMDGYDGASYGCGGVNFDSSQAQWVSLRTSMGYTRSYALRMPLDRMAPQNALASTSYCLATSSASDAAILVYQPAWGSSFTVNLGGISGSMSVEWFDPETGITTAGGTVAAGGVRSFQPPMSYDAVMYLKSMNGGTVPTGSLEASATTLPIGGGPVTLSWTSAGATSASIDNGVGSVELTGTRELSVTATTTFTLTLSGQGGSSAYSVTVNVALPPTVTVYAEQALAAPWSDIRSWSVTRTYSNASPVYEGATSIRVVHQPWGSLQFSQGVWGSFTTFDPDAYESLDFAVHGGTTGLTLRVSCFDGSNTSIKTPVSIQVPANTWVSRSIPLSQLATVPFTSLQFNAGGSNVTFYLDNVRLTVKPTGPVDPPTLAAPAPRTPADLAIAQPLTVSFGWSPVAGATSYRLQLSRDTSFATVDRDISGVSDTTAVFSGLLPSTTYAWRVRGASATTVGPYSPTRRFTTMIPPPAAPTLVAPAELASLGSTAVDLQWRSTPGASSYGLQVATDAAFAALVLNRTGLTDTISPVTSLTPGSTYFWRVNATGPGGTGVFSVTRSFSIGALPAAVDLATPPDGSTGLASTVSLAWRGLSGGLTYHLQVAADAQFTSLNVNDSTLADTARATGPLAPGSTWFWRVRGRNGMGWGPFSPSWRFTVSPPAPPSANVIYQDQALAPPWNDIRSWSITRNYASTSPVFEGSTSARFVHSSWAALQFSQGTWGAFTSIDPSPYQSLDLVVHGGTSGVTLHASCYNASGRSIKTPVVFTVPPNTWQERSIPMAQLADVPFVSVYLTARGSSVTFSLDNVRLTFRSAAGPSDESIDLMAGGERAEVPAGYALAPNFPNPFNPSTTVRYDLPERSSISLTVIDLLGRTVAELAQGERSAGSHTAVWHAAVGSGVYYLRMDAVSTEDPAKRFTQVRRMLLMR